MEEFRVLIYFKDFQTLDKHGVFKMGIFCLNKYLFKSNLELFSNIKFVYEHIRELFFNAYI